MEIVASSNLREMLKLKDGDEVEAKIVLEWGLLGLFAFFFEEVS